MMPNYSRYHLMSVWNQIPEDALKMTFYMLLISPVFPICWTPRSNLCWSVFTYEGSDQGFGGSHPAARRHGTAGAEGGRLHSIGGDEPLFLGRGAWRAAASLTFFGARREAEALQRRQRVRGKGWNSRAAAAAVAVVLMFASFGARAARVWGQENQGAVIF